MTQYIDVDALRDTVAGLDRMVLVHLAEAGKRSPQPPTFRGRCLDPVYLAAVAAGAWSLDDEAALTTYEDQLDQLALSRVRMTDRKGLRAALHGALLGVVTRDLPVDGWAARCEEVARPWTSVVGPLPRSRPDLVTLS